MEFGASQYASEFGVVLCGPSTATDAFETYAEVADALSTNWLLMSGASYTRTDPRFAVVLSSLQSK
jgi:hypothetical protein